MFPLASSFSILGGARDPGMVDCRLYPKSKDPNTRVLRPKYNEYYTQKTPLFGSLDP